MEPNFPFSLNKKPLVFFQMQGYGDLVILINVLKKISVASTHNEICMGQYLKKLFIALDYKADTIFLNTNSADIPPIFNLKRDGLFKGIKSAIEISKLLKKNNNKRKFQMVFVDGTTNLLGLREIFISRGIERKFIKKQSNIYHSYIEFFKSVGNIINEENFYKVKKENEYLAIFPSSRQKFKCIPEDEIRLVVNSCKKYGIKPKIFNLVDEGTYAKDLMCYYQQLPRSFEKTIMAIKNSVGLVSSDSLPAHLGEFLDIPTYVLSSKKNEYWLPMRSFDNGFWNTFNDFRTEKASFLNFLNAL